MDNLYKNTLSSTDDFYKSHSTIHEEVKSEYFDDGEEEDLDDDGLCGFDEEEIHIQKSIAIANAQANKEPKYISIQVPLDMDPIEVEELLKEYENKIKHSKNTYSPDLNSILQLSQGVKLVPNYTESRKLFSPETYIVEIYNRGVKIPLATARYKPVETEYLSSRRIQTSAHIISEGPIDVLEKLKETYYDYEASNRLRGSIALKILLDNSDEYKLVTDFMIMSTEVYNCGGDTPIFTYTIQY